MVTKITIDIRGKKPDKKFYSFTFICYETDVNTKRMEDEFYKKVGIKFKKKTILYELQILNAIETKVDKDSFKMYVSKKYPGEKYVPPTKVIKSVGDASDYLRLLCSDMVFRLENNRSIKKELDTSFLARIYNRLGDLDQYLQMMYGITIQQKNIQYVLQH